MNLSSEEEVDILRLQVNDRIRLRDRVIRELPLAIFVNEVEIGTLLCTPPKLKELAVGFLLSQGVLQTGDRRRIRETYFNPEKSFVQVHIDMPTQTIRKLISKRLVASSCGACSLYDIPYPRDTESLDSPFCIKKETLFAAMREFEERSTLFKTTGGNHSCALYGTDRLEVFAEDLGRHNALDKVLGECFMRGMEIKDKFLLLSGRISWEILGKVTRRVIPLLASPSAPTDLAVSWANKLNITLVGFLRQERMNIYTHPQRII